MTRKLVTLICTYLCALHSVAHAVGVEEIQAAKARLHSPEEPGVTVIHTSVAIQTAQASQPSPPLSTTAQSGTAAAGINQSETCAHPTTPPDASTTPSSLTDDNERRASASSMIAMEAIWTEQSPCPSPHTTTGNQPETSGAPCQSVAQFAHTATVPASEAPVIPSNTASTSNPTERNLIQRAINTLWSGVMQAKHGISACFAGLIHFARKLCRRNYADNAPITQSDAASIEKKSN